MTDDNRTDAVGSDRWTMVRDMAVLQVKLIVDGLRDFLLVPASLVAAMMSLASSEDGKPGPQFYRLLRLGKRSERWINLFGALDNAPSDVGEAEVADDMSMDDLVAKLEGYVVDEYKRGGVTSQAKKRFDAAISAIQRRAGGGGDGDPPSDA